MLIYRMIGRPTILSALQAKFSGRGSKIDYDRYSRYNPDGRYLDEFFDKNVTINILDIRPLLGYSSARICTYEVLAEGVPYAKRCCESTWSSSDWQLSARYLIKALDAVPTYRFEKFTVNITGESAISNMVNPASFTR